MSRGRSGRVVVELDPELKRELYAGLSREGLTLKDWFIERARRYVEAGSGDHKKRKIGKQEPGPAQG